MKKKEKREENERKGLTLTGLLMEGLGVTTVPAYLNPNKFFRHTVVFCPPFPISWLGGRASP
jgi:hypothetical protein